VTLRIILQGVNYGAAANVGGPVFTEFKTFDIEAPEIEAWLSETIPYGHRQVAGAEVVAALTQPNGGQNDQ
jgi:hypothetical protein